MDKSKVIILKEEGQSSAYSIGQAQLLFLDAIQRGQSELAESLREHPIAIKKSVEDTAALIQSAVNDMAKAVKSIPVNTPPANNNFKTFSDAIRSLSDTITVSYNRLASETSKNVDVLNKILSELEAPKEWDMEIDRNYTTNLIQKVIIRKRKE